MSFESQSFENSNPDVNSPARQARTLVEEVIANKDLGISSEDVEKFFTKCVQEEGNYYVIRGKTLREESEGYVTANRHIPKNGIPHGDDAKDLIKDFALETLKSGQDIDDLLAEDITYFPERDE